jgi:hypothetical protein
MGELNKLRGELAAMREDLGKLVMAVRGLVQLQNVLESRRSPTLRC